MNESDKMFWKRIYLTVGMNFFHPPSVGYWVHTDDPIKQEEHKKLVELYERTVIEPMMLNFSEKFIPNLEGKGWKEQSMVKFTQQFVNKFTAE